MNDININLFEHSEFNTLLNNVSGGAVSNIFKKINPYQPGVLEPVQMLDENYTDPRFTLPRYEGCKTTSAKYNVYTEGDKSYGKTAAIDYTVGKFAFSNNINKKNLNFYDKAVVNIKYLIDVTGSIIELSTANTNIFEVQNMYKKGDKVTLSLMDKYNPTNQSTLDGDKTVFEGGFSYSPIIYREIGEVMNFTYIEPVTTTQNRLGVRAVSTSSIVWKTIGDTNGEFTTNPNAGTIFTVNGVNKTTPLTVGIKVQSNNWPYLKIPLTDYNRNAAGVNTPYKDYLYQTHYIGSQDISADNPSFYSIDYFLPSETGSANGGYGTNDVIGKFQVINNSSEYYAYLVAPRSSDYSVNIDIPIKIKARNAETPGERGEEKGPSIVKVIGILEVQKSGTSTWEYLDYSNSANPTPYGYTRFSATNIPRANGGREATGTTRALINEENSFIYMSADTAATTVNGIYVSPFYEGRCQLLNHKIKLSINDKIRLKVYFAEVTTFFRRNDNISFEVPSGDSSKSYFEVYDLNNSDTTLLTTATIVDSPPIFTTEPDNITLTFSDTASLFYKNVIFEPQDTTNPKAIPASLYSAVDFPFEFKKYDILRFTKFFTINPEYYYILEVNDPVTQQIGNVTSVLKPLQIVLDRQYIPNTVSTGSFAFFRKSPDETCVMINFKKREGLTSNALLLPFNLEENMRKNIGNIIAPLKDTVLSKVLVVG
jgi:hypothetical protein